MGAGIDIGGGTISGRCGAVRESGLLPIGISGGHGTVGAGGVHQQCHAPCLCLLRSCCELAGKHESGVGRNVRGICLVPRLSLRPN